MKETDQERTARQAKLQKALSAAYLSHQINELESQVQHTHLVSKTSEKKGPTVVVDASALMFAPKRVRDAVKSGKEVIVPSEVFHTLDLLKKGPGPMATAARAATRYMEHASRQVQSQSQPQAQGLRMQRSSETSPPTLPAGGDTTPPKWVLSTLACAKYFAPDAVFWTAKSPSAGLGYVSSGKGAGEAEEAELRYGERAAGDAVRFWADVCGLQTTLVTDIEKHKAKVETKPASQIPAAATPPQAPPNKSNVQIARPLKSAAPVLLKREARAETSQPAILKRKPQSATSTSLRAHSPTASPSVQASTYRPVTAAPVRAIGRYLDNDDDDPPPVRSARKPSGHPQDGFKLLKRAEEPRARLNVSRDVKDAPQGPPKIVLLQRPK